MSDYSGMMDKRARELDDLFPGGWDVAYSQADADKLFAGGITAVRPTGEAWPDGGECTDYAPVVEIPEDVRDNSETVTDYAFMRHLSPLPIFHGVAERDRQLGLPNLFPSLRHTIYSWLDVNPDGQRSRFDMIVDRHGKVVNLFHTEYWTRIACGMGDWCHSYASHYTVIVDSEGKESDAVPYCEAHVDEMRRNIAGLPMVMRLSERLLVGGH